MQTAHDKHADTCEQHAAQSRQSGQKAPRSGSRPHSEIEQKTGG
jgi:hypothetical protein